MRLDVGALAVFLLLLIETQARPFLNWGTDGWYPESGPDPEDQNGKDRWEEIGHVISQGTFVDWSPGHGLADIGHGRPG